jgi:phenylpropionate dioxygenase-like ring-hydroxylating dioxygenase large terminal subunit
MTDYRQQPEAIQALVQEDRVHRDVYLSEALFALEQERFFARTWLFAGHASQVPNAGDYWSLELAGRPLMMVRQADGSVCMLYNRCAHKGAQLVSEESGHTGKLFR